MTCATEFSEVWVTRSSPSAAFTNVYCVITVLSVSVRDGQENITSFKVLSGVGAA